MIGAKLFGEGGEPDFRWRGGNVSRIEALTDAVFALSLTLIVVTLEPPRTWLELRETFVQTPVFAACFAVLAWLWLTHYRFHRRFGLEDLGTTWLNFALLFLIVTYVYPLRFLAGFLYSVLVLRRGWTVDDGAGGRAALFESNEQIQQLMWIYGGGFAAIFLCFAALYGRAWRLRAELELDSVERVRTKAAVHSHLLSAAVGLISASIAAFDARWAGVSGVFYAVLGPLHFVHGLATARAVERFRNKTPGAPSP